MGTPTFPRGWRRWPWGVAASLLAFGGLTALLAPLLGQAHLLDVALLYLLLTLIVSAVWGYGAGLLAALLANLLLNFFFVPPVHTLTVGSPENVMGLLVFLAVAGVGASMLAMLRRQLEVAEAGQTEAGILLEVGHAVGRAPTPEAALTALCETVASRLNLTRAAVLRLDGEWTVAGSSHEHSDEMRLDPIEVERAAQSSASGRVVRLADAARTFVPFPPAATHQGALLLIGRLRTPRRLDQERLLRALAAEASVTLHRVELAEEAQRAGELERADALKATLLSSVSHDLRSPLTAIKAAVGSLRSPGMQWSEEDAQGFLATIEAQTDRLTGVVSDLLEMARLEAGVANVRLEPVEVGLLLRDVAQATVAATCGRAVTTSAPDGLWSCTDYRLTMQALENLVDNAARYSVPGGAIRLTAAHADGLVVVRVSDEGPGIPDEDLPHVFEKFYRGVQGRRSRGSGLGLAIARAMVELCGGAISARSSLRGTVFEVRLPAAEAPR